MFNLISNVLVFNLGYDMFKLKGKVYDENSRLLEIRAGPF